MKERKYNGGQWTEARFNSFIKNALRAASLKWPPKFNVRTAARTSRGVYLCAGYSRQPHSVRASLPPKKGNKKRINNVQVDHVKPVIDPRTGFTSWDNVIKRMFCEAEGLQVLCHDCHQKKTKAEREEAKEFNRKVTSY